MKDRDLSLDIIRILACSLVILMHSPIPSENADGPFLAALSYFTAPCIGLFFMVSGALLLPVKLDYFTFIKKRISKIIIPTLIWTAIYLCLNIYFSMSEIDIVRAVVSIPFSPQGHGVLWFMYTLIGLYLLAPILSGWLHTATDKELRFVLILWAITLCYPFLSFFVEINSSSTGILYYFTGYAGYFLLGYALKSKRIQINSVVTSIIVAVGLFILITLKQFNIAFDFYSLFWYESIFIAALCMMYWKILSIITRKINVRKRGQRNICLLSNICFGIYLLHILIMRYWLWNLSWIVSINNYILQTFVVAVLTMLFSACLCIALCRIPILDNIVGYSYRKC